MKKFLIILILITFLFSVLLEAGSRWGLFSKPSYGIAIILLLSFFTGIIFSLLHKIKSASFTQAYILSIVIKLLLGGIFISVILVADQTNAEPNALLFIIAYFVFTALEVLFLFQKINNRLSN